MKPVYSIYGLSLLLFAVTTSLRAQQKPISLRDAYQIASKANRQLQIQVLEKRSAEQAVKEAKSHLLPTVSVSANYSFFTDRAVIFLRDETADKKVNPVKVGGRN